jgi:hypothetical protein
LTLLSICDILPSISAPRTNAPTSEGDVIKMTKNSDDGIVAPTETGANSINYAKRVRRDRVILMVLVILFAIAVITAVNQFQTASNAYQSQRYEQVAASTNIAMYAEGVAFVCFILSVRTAMLYIEAIVKEASFRPSK